jgi:hypothetical protein
MLLERPEVKCKVGMFCVHSLKDIDEEFLGGVTTSINKDKLGHQPPPMAVDCHNGGRYSCRIDRIGYFRTGMCV